jgi:hypothetical protein
MAIRPVFIPNIKSPGVIIKNINFTWNPGLSISQKQKNIDALHNSALQQNISPLLEISSKSKDTLGVDLSSFNLSIETVNKNKITVECAFQGSKVFENGGPYQDLYLMNSREAKNDDRLRQSGRLTKFKIYDREFPLYPNTFFYDWLYINAINKHDKFKSEIIKYKGFTDIEFNPERSINCQAYSAALFVSLAKLSKVEESLKSPDRFLYVLKKEYNKYRPIREQSNLQFDT